GALPGRSREGRRGRRAAGAARGGQPGRTGLRRFRGPAHHRGSGRVRAVRALRQRRRVRGAPGQPALHGDRRGADQAAAGGPVRRVLRGRRAPWVTDLVYREAGADSQARSAHIVAVAGRDRTVTVDPVLLFRFSALTYNAHRIHYDREFARAEGYPGLVVHGPLQALLMAGLARPFGTE